MIRLLYALDIEAVTAELNTRLLRPLRAGRRYRFEARLVEDKGRLVLTEAEAFDAETGEKVASGSAKCARVGKTTGTRAVPRIDGSANLPGDGRDVVGVVAPQDAQLHVCGDREPGGDDRPGVRLAEHDPINGGVEAFACEECPEVARIVRVQVCHVP